MDFQPIEGGLFPKDVRQTEALWGGEEEWGRVDKRKKELR